MSLFGYGKKKAGERNSSCCCGGDYTSENMQAAEKEKSKMGIKILGGGCA